MHDLINVKELTTDVLTEKVVEMVQELQRRVNGGVVSTSTETVEETTATVGETEIIEHEGLKLKRVNRIAKPGDYIRPTISVGGLKSGEIYGPVKQDDIVDELVADGRLIYWRERTPSTVEVFEVVDVQAEKLPFPEVELTANQKRAKLIEQAKKFVEEQKYLSYNFYIFENNSVIPYFYSKNNRVTCVLNGTDTGKAYSVGRADCSEGDVFNEHIGKAIALARALEIDVPGEFLNAVQPTDAVVGMNVELRGGVKPYTDAVVNENRHLRHDIENVHSHLIKIIDDTNAQYEVV